MDKRRQMKRYKFKMSSWYASYGTGKWWLSSTSWVNRNSPMVDDIKNVLLRIEDGIIYDLDRGKDAYAYRTDNE